MSDKKQKINWIEDAYHKKDNVKIINIIQNCKLAENKNIDKRIVYNITNKNLTIKDT